MKFPLLMFFAMLFSSIAFAQPVQTTGPLNTLRANHQSILLQSGKVIAFGGQNNGILSSAELYDPSTGLWKGTTSMNQSRSKFAAALLQDGRVLAIGGSDGTAETNTAEIYDPATEVWTYTGNTANNTSFNSAVTLQDGRVLMAYLTNCEIYDPAAGTWSGAASPSEFHKVLVLLNDGKVLYIGTTNSGEVYDPGTDTWTATTNGLRSTTNSADAISVLGDGRVMIMGATSGHVDIYDPSTNSFSAGADFVLANPFCRSAVFNNGNVLIFGASSSADPGDTKTIQVYNPGDDQWYTSSYNFYGPAGANMHTLQDGTMLSVGGSAKNGGLDVNCYRISASVGAVSIERFPEAEFITLAPNPFENFVNVDLADAFAKGAFEIQISNIEGKSITRERLSQVQTQISLRHLPQGIYLYQLFNEGRFVKSGKLIKR